MASNKVSRGPLKELEVVNDSGQFSNVVKAAQDAKYLVDGIDFMNSANW
ncbi:hypothetical protein [Effusibacillus lacus]|nr:hypothetical protein [Effusibacillus lacus]